MTEERRNFDNVRCVPLRPGALLTCSRFIFFNYSDLGKSHPTVGKPECCVRVCPELVQWCFARELTSVCLIKHIIYYSRETNIKQYKNI